MALVPHAKRRDCFLLVALAVGFGTAALNAGRLGLSLALGAFLGRSPQSASSDHVHDAMTPRLLAVRDAFVALFFGSTIGHADRSGGR